MHAEKVKKQGYLDIEHLNGLEEINMHLELIERARKYREKKDYNMSLNCLEEAIKIMETEDAYKEMAEVYLMKQEIKIAILKLDRAMKAIDKKVKKYQRAKKRSKQI